LKRVRTIIWAHVPPWTLCPATIVIDPDGQPFFVDAAASGLVYSIESTIPGACDGDFTRDALI
jgi:hypothetical protein